MRKCTRRTASKLLLGASGSALLLPASWSFKAEKMIKREISSSGEWLPVVGLGTWQSFDVGNQTSSRKGLKEVLVKMKELGGQMIDSSPMYGSSERVVGDLTRELNIRDAFFYATKVWTHGRDAGIRQMNSSMRKMGRTQMDLMQIHNLVDLDTHIKTLRSWKENGKIRYWGITHYTNGSHETLAGIIKKERPDFVQFNYSINQRNAEKRLLPTAQEYRCSVIINRPYDGGSLFRRTKGRTLPGWCQEQGITSWGQFFLKFILANKAVNCVIPGTSKPHHLVDNMGAGYGKLPDKVVRQEMLKVLQY